MTPSASKIQKMQSSLKIRATYHPVLASPENIQLSYCNPEPPNVMAHLPQQLLKLTKDILHGKDTIS